MPDTLQPQINIVPPPECFLPSEEGNCWAEKAINCNSEKVLHKDYSSCACKQLSYSGSLTLRICIHIYAHVYMQMYISPEHFKCKIVTWVACAILRIYKNFVLYSYSHVFAVMFGKQCNTDGHLCTASSFWNSTPLFGIPGTSTSLPKL